MDWPVLEGRYNVGNPNSPVAICTMSSVDLEFPMDKIAIVGKCVTENLGVEKIVKNVIANPSIRFLIICGRESVGHFVDDAIESLIKNGVDEEGRIIGAKGGIPVLKNLSREETERFRRQVTPVNVAGETDTDKIMTAVEECFSRNPGPIEGETVRREEAKKISAPPHDDADYRQDPLGYFIIYPSHGEIFVEHHENNGRLTQIIVGNKAEDLFHQIVKLGLLSDYLHAAYLGKELEKAEIAMRADWDYEQDADLFPGKMEKISAKPEEALNESGERIKRITFMNAGVKEISFEFKAGPEEEEFKKILRDVGLYRIFG